MLCSEVWLDSPGSASFELAPEKTLNRTATFMLFYFLFTVLITANNRVLAVQACKQPAGALRYSTLGRNNS